MCKLTVLTRWNVANGTAGVNGSLALSSALLGSTVGLALPLWDQDSPELGALVASFWFGNEDREMCCRRKP